MSYLETKRNALLNSVASSSAIELLETKTITEDTYRIDFDVDTDTYKAFFIKGDFVFNQSNNNWIYIEVNGRLTETNTNFIGSFAQNNVSIPQVPTSEGDGLAFPIIYSKNLKGGCSVNKGGKPNLNNVQYYEDVYQLTLHAYQNGRFANGTTLELYGMKQSLIF